MKSKVERVVDANPLATRARIEGEELHVHLKGGKHLRLPMRWFPFLDGAPAAARQKVRVSPSGFSIRWPDLNYELGVSGLSRQRRKLSKYYPRG